MPIKMAKIKILKNQPLKIAIGFIAGAVKKISSFAVQQEFCA